MAKHVLSAAAVLCFCGVAAFGQQTDSSTNVVSSLSQLHGLWEGTLEYLDYGDNETRVSLPASAKYEETDRGVSFDISFGEPDGRTVKDSGRFERLPSGKFALGDEEYALVSFKPTDGPGFTLVLSARGQDAGRSAEFRQTIQLDGGVLKLRKDVRVDGSPDFFNRNELRLERYKPSIEDLAGTWRVDLRPTPDAEPYYQQFVVSARGGSVEGTFYGDPFSDFQFNTDWGVLHFAFVTEDGSGVYNTSGRLVDGRLEGRTHSMGRKFLSVWSADRTPGSK